MRMSRGKGKGRGIMIIRGFPGCVISGLGSLLRICLMCMRDGGKMIGLLSLWRDCCIIWLLMRRVRLPLKSFKLKCRIPLFGKKLKWNY